MTKMMLTVGASCSGKTTWAEQYCKDNPETVNINRDDIRFNAVTGGVRDWRLYKFSRSNETAVTGIARGMALDALAERKEIIISDTNLNEAYREEWKELADAAGYEYEEVPFYVPWRELVVRHQFRSNSISKSILWQQYLNMNNYMGRRVHQPTEDLPKAFLVDIDGTIADMKGVRGPFEWDKVGMDKPRSLVISIVHSWMNMGLNPIFLSGRDDICSEATYDWIMCNVFGNEQLDCQDFGFPLIMRKHGDQRPDTEVKEDMFFDYIAKNWNVVAAIDDRPCMVQRWHELGIKNVIAVADQLKEF